MNNPTNRSIPEGTALKTTDCGCVVTVAGHHWIDACDHHAPFIQGTAAYAALHPVVSAYTVGETVEVHSFGRYYRGIVTKLARTRMTVKYTAGKGKSYERAVSSDSVKKLGT